MVNWDEAVTELTAPGAPFELTEQIVVGTPTKVFAATPNSLRELFGTARMRGDEPYLVYEDETWTYADLLEQIDGFAHALVHTYRVQPGDRVAIAMRNYPEWIAAFAAAVSVGAIAVALNAWWVTDELDY